MDYKIHVCDPKVFNETMTSIYFVVEYFNYSLYRDKFNEKDTSLLNLFNKSIKKLIELLNRNNGLCNDLPLVLSYCIECGIKPKIDDKAVVLVKRWLSDRAKDLFINDSFPDDLVKSSLYLKEPYKLKIKFTSCNIKMGSGWVSSQFKIEHKRDILVDLPNLKHTFLDESIDFTDVMQDILVKYNKMNDDPSRHYIQRWIRSTFRIEYNINTKTAFSSITNEINKAFYSTSYVSRQKFKSSRSAIIEIKVIISKVLEVFDKGEGHFNLLNAIGVYLLLRLCKSLRVRYMWIGKESIDPQKKVSFDPSHDSLKDLFKGVHCVSALRPIEYNYFQAKSFGSYSCIKGLNTLFRGGLLPYTDNGKATTIIGQPGSGKTTFALQRMVEIAYYGGLSVYFTFEEDNIIILDRLNSFRLVRFSHFNISPVDFSSLKYVMKKSAKNSPGKGLLLIYAIHHNIKRNEIGRIIHEISEYAAKYGWVYRALTIDSINSLDFKLNGLFRQVTTKLYKRMCARELIDSIKKNNFSGLILSEKDDEEFFMLPYLSDVVIEIGSRQNGRWIEIKKARNQNYQWGKHPLRISDGKGIVIYPSITTVLSKLKNRIRSTISEERIITFPGKIEENIGVGGILEKSSTLIYGNARDGITNFVYSLICKKRNILERDDKIAISKLVQKPETILVVTFRTPEVRLNQLIRSYDDIYGEWQSIPNKIIRNFTPGDDITPEQIIDDIYQFIKITKRQGYPIQRIVFDEIESAKKNLPLLKTSELFWPTICEMLSCEAITSFFVVETNNVQNKEINFLKNQMDYIFRILRKNELDNGSKEIDIYVQKWINPNDHKSHGPVNTAGKIYLNYDSGAA